MTLNDLNYLGAALTALRRRTGKMQKDVADETGMSRSQVSRYERGRDTPNLVTLVKYLAIIGNDFRDLHDSLQEVKAQHGAKDLEKPSSLIEFEKAMVHRLPYAPALRHHMEEILSPMFHEMERLKQTVIDLRAESSVNTAGLEAGAAIPDDEDRRNYS